jgi:ubiquinone/menaquinone biosynthesis C-methylase UbiE
MPRLSAVPSRMGQLICTVSILNRSSAKAHIMSELKQVISEKITCFECNGDFSFTNDTLVCQKCSKQYTLNKNSIAFDNSKFRDQYGKQFGEQAQDYEQHHSLNEGFSRGLALTLKRTLEKFTTLPVDSALEIGCGTGVLTRGCNYHRIAQYFLATDISEKMLDVAIKRETSDNVLYLLQDASKLNVKDNSFDIVIGNAILHHITWLKSSLTKIHRILKPRGVAAFQEPLYYGNQFVAFLMNIVIEHLEQIPV